MKQLLLLVAVTAFVSLVHAQKKISAYAITGLQKGQSGWTEVRVVDITTGDELQSVYKTAKDVEVLNARTGKPIQKKAVADNLNSVQALRVREAGNGQELRRLQELEKVREVRELNKTPLAQQANTVEKRKLEDVIISTKINNNFTTDVNGNINRVVIVNGYRTSPDKPFATNSAALAYDRKNERLYYTPMNIAQLRYIDLKTGKVYYFEDESFGVVQGRGDVHNQITRMVFASDGNGYALTNDAKHLIKFTTGKKPVITDLGALTDNASNGSYSIHSSSRFGGDMIADADRNLYLIGADRTVYKISLETKVASYLGKIKGLPNGFSTNGAIAEGGSSVIVTSSTSTIGYFRFDLNTLQSEKVSTGNTVYNASDLANGILAFEKTKKKKEKQRDYVPVNDVVVIDEVVKEEPSIMEKTTRKPLAQAGSVSVYPNPVRNGSSLRLSFADQLPGKYQVELLDISGRVVSRKQVVINNKMQVEELQLPKNMANGSYLVNVVNAANKATTVDKIVVR